MSSSRGGRGPNRRGAQPMWLLALCFAALCSAADAALVHGPWSDVQASPLDRARLLVNNMTLDEKLNFLHGTGMVESNKTNGAYTGNVFPGP